MNFFKIKIHNNEKKINYLFNDFVEKKKKAFDRATTTTKKKKLVSQRLGVVEREWDVIVNRT